jgi:hypothetical protein
MKNKLKAYIKKLKTWQPPSVGSASGEMTKRMIISDLEELLKHEK